jgi:hypothetical protein
MKHQIIYPGETSEVNYWIKRWGISREELNEAILQTGSLRVKEIRDYLKKKKVALGSVNLNSLMRLIRLYL